MSAVTVAHPMAVEQGSAGKPTNTIVKVIDVDEGYRLERG